MDRGEVPYGEGHIELGLGSDMRFALFIQPEYSQRDLFWTRFLAVLQVASLPICYLGGLILCAVPSGAGGCAAPSWPWSGPARA